MIKKNKAVFLDRDGVINKKRDDYVKSVNELEIFSYVGDSIWKLKKLGFLVIVITNQSIINRKIITSQELEKIHTAIQKYLEKKHCNIDKFYFCPHLPDEKCNCRKPKSGLILKAIEDFGINISDSWIVGDCMTDVQAGENVGCKTILLKENFSLVEAVRIIEEEN